MQAVKDKLNDMSAMRKAKANAKAEEKVNAVNILYIHVFYLTVN